MVLVCLVIAAVWALFVQDKLIGWMRNLRVPDEVQAEVTDERRNKKQTRQPTRSKLVEFWKSNPLWWAVGMIFAIALQRLPLLFSFIALWIVLTVEIIRLKVFSQSWKLLGNAFGSLIVAALLCGVWKIVPPPAATPTLDQQTNAFFGILSKKAPWLVSPPEPRPVIIRSNQEATMEFTRTQIDMSAGAIFTTNRPTVAVIGFNNTSPGAAHDVYAEAILELLPRAGNIYTSKAAVKAAEQEENRRFHAFRQRWLCNSYKGEGNDHEKDHEEIIAAKTHPLSWDEVKDVGTGRKYLYAFGAIKWRDDTGSYETDLCWYYEGLDGVDNGVQKVVWTKCMDGHYKVRRPFKSEQD